VTFARDPDWTTTGSGFVVVEACDVAGDAAREAVLAGPAGSEIAGVVSGLPAASALACGDLRADEGRQEVALLGVDGVIRVVSGAGEVRWDSTVDLDPPLAVSGTGIAVGDVPPAFEAGPRDLVVAPDLAAGAVPFVVLQQESVTGAFTVTSAPDPAPDVAAIGVQLTRLRGY